MPIDFAIDNALSNASFSLCMLVLKDGKVTLIYEKTITPYGNGAKVDAPKKHIGKRAYVVIMKN